MKSPRTDARFRAICNTSGELRLRAFFVGLEIRNRREILITAETRANILMSCSNADAHARAYLIYTSRCGVFCDANQIVNQSLMKLLTRRMGNAH